MKKLFCVLCIVAFGAIFFTSCSKGCTCKMTMNPYPMFEDPNMSAEDCDAKQQELNADGLGMIKCK